jgi:hypothetical protein
MVLGRIDNAIQGASKPPQNGVGNDVSTQNGRGYTDYRSVSDNPVIDCSQHQICHYCTDDDAAEHRVHSGVRNGDSVASSRQSSPFMIEFQFFILASVKFSPINTYLF